MPYGAAYKVSLGRLLIVDGSLIASLKHVGSSKLYLPSAVALLLFAVPYLSTPRQNYGWRDYDPMERQRSSTEISRPTISRSHFLFYSFGFFSWRKSALQTLSFKLNCNLLHLPSSIGPGPIKQSLLLTMLLLSSWRFVLRFGLRVRNRLSLFALLLRDLLKMAATMVRYPQTEHELRLFCLCVIQSEAKTGKWSDRTIRLPKRTVSRSSGRNHGTQRTKQTNRRRISLASSIIIGPARRRCNGFFFSLAYVFSEHPLTLT